MQPACPQEQGCETTDPLPRFYVMTLQENVNVT